MEKAALEALPGGQRGPSGGLEGKASEVRVAAVTIPHPARAACGAGTAGRASR